MVTLLAKYPKGILDNGYLLVHFCFGLFRYIRFCDFVGVKGIYGEAVRRGTGFFRNMDNNFESLILVNDWLTP